MRTTYVYGTEFWDFYYAQRPDVQDKIDWIIGLVRTLRMVPEKFFKHLEGADGLFEIEKAVRLKKNYYEEKSRK